MRRIRKQEEIAMKGEPMKAYNLYLLNVGGRKLANCVVIACSPKEAASILGGEYTEMPGGRKTSVMGSDNADELNFVGIVSFAPELFRKMDETDRALAGIYGGSGVFHKGSLHLITYGEPVKLLMYERGVMFPDYVKFEGYEE